MNGFGGMSATMADYSTASSNANSALNTKSSSGVKSYRIGEFMADHGNPLEQVKMAAMLEGLAARRSEGSIVRVGRMSAERPG